MGRIAAYGMNLSVNVIALPVQICIAATRAIGLDGPARGALSLVADEEDVVPRVVQHGFQIIDNSTAAAHSVPCNDDGRTSGFRQVADHGQMCLVAVNGEQLRELQWVATLFHSLQRFVIPERLEVAVDLGETAGQGRVEDDG